MHIRSFDGLRLFCAVAEKMSFTAAGTALNMSKGAISHQIAKLEDELPFQLFERRHTHIYLTARREELWTAAKRTFAHLESVIADHACKRAATLDSLENSIGHLCPSRQRQLSRAKLSSVRESPEVQDGLKAQFRCNAHRAETDRSIWRSAKRTNLPKWKFGDSRVATSLPLALCAADCRSRHGSL